MNNDIPDQNPNANKPTKNSDQKTVTAIYAALCASIALQITPSVGLFTFGGLLFLFTWAMIGFLRRGADQHGLLANHMMFLNITLWVFSALTLIITAGVGYYLQTRYNLNDLLELAQDYANGNTDGESMHGLRMAVIGAGVPCYGYIVYRLVKGLRRALNGYRIAEPKNPF